MFLAHSPKPTQLSYQMVRTPLECYFAMSTGKALGKLARSLFSCAFARFRTPVNPAHNRTNTQQGPAIQQLPAFLVFVK